MARVSIAEVKVILPTGYTLTDAQIQVSIDTATIMVDEVALNSTEFTDARLKQIELYLSAHFASITDMTMNITSERDGACDSSAVYGFKAGEGIMGSPFGASANTLSGGVLKQYDMTPATIVSVGTL